MNWRLRDWTSAALGALLLASPALAATPATPGTGGAAPAAPADPRPALWLLADADTRIYLFGTFHILPPGFRWRSPAIEEAIRDSGELVLEVAERDVMNDPTALVRHLMLGKEAPLAWRVSPDRREALDAMIAATGLPAATFDSMQTWAAVMTIAVTQIVRGQGGGEESPLDISRMQGVEEALERDFANAGRPVSGVETAAQQIGFFGALSFADQRGLLEQMIDAHRAGETAADDASELDWVRGDVDSLADSLGREEMPPMLYETLITSRNRAWTDWLIARLDRPGTILFAVGAAHLAGPDSVQTMLAGRGFTARRID